MSLYNKIGILAATITLSFGCLITEDTNAQGLGNSPYSSLGLGELYGDAFSDNTGMGQSGVSVGNGFQTNNLNPALWSRNRFTTLDIGLIGQYKDIVSGSKNQRNSGGNLAYVSLAFPVSKIWTLGASLKPYSFVDFENTSERNIPGTTNSATYYNSGKGGLNKASITNAFQIGKYLSLGLEASYFFGNVRKASELAMPMDNSAAAYLVGINERTTYSDFAFKGGAAVRIPVKKDNKLFFNLGGTYNIKSNINGSQTTTLELSQNSFVDASDTLTNDVSGTLTLPAQYQVGMSFEWPVKLILSADYSHASWSEYRDFNGSNNRLKDAGRIHLGAEYIPDFFSLKYIKRVRYRVGFSHGKTPYSVGANDVKDTNVSLGFTFPMGQGFQNLISVSFVGGQRGLTGNGIVRERYARAVLGITLLDRWFIKQKID
jgi:hypothetical protein